MLLSLIWSTGVAHAAAAESVAAKVACLAVDVPLLVTHAGLTVNTDTDTQVCC